MSFQRSKTLSDCRKLYKIRYRRSRELLIKKKEMRGSEGASIPNRHTLYLLTDSEGLRGHMPDNRRDLNSLVDAEALDIVKKRGRNYYIPSVDMYNQIVKEVEAEYAKEE